MAGSLNVSNYALNSDLSIHQTSSYTRLLRCWYAQWFERQLEFL